MFLLLTTKIMTPGICTLSNIPIRKEANNTSEMVSMLLFGECVQIEQTENDWSKIKTITDQYDGWVSSKQLTPLNTIPSSFTTVTQYPFAILQSKRGIIMAPCGSQLPYYDGSICTVNDLEYVVSTLQNKMVLKDITYIAMQYLNVPYLWGGRSPFGIDCSGFMQSVYACIGVELKRDAYQQAEMGSTIAFLQESKAGDLAFFDNEEGKITHVGMMLDNHTIIHASGKVRVDTIDSYGILNADDHQYSHRLRIIKRIVA